MRTRGTRAIGAAARGAGRGRRGFTLLEVLVAIGAVALISVGLAAVFDAVGRTVSGGRRVSALNTYAGLVERQMAADFRAMTREGFLVIRHQAVDRNGDGRVEWSRFDATEDRVPLLPDQDPGEQRTRRIDELMFFAKGEFTTARQPMHPDVVARAPAARIYYGHGQRRRAEIGDLESDMRLSNAVPTFRQPQLDDDNVHQNGTTAGEPPRLGRPGADNPNQFASTWSLLRHVTLLAQPELGRRLPEAASAFNMTAIVQADKEYQVGLQPAAASVFRTLARRVPAPASWGTSPVNLYARDQEMDLRRPGTRTPTANPLGEANRFPPTIASGIVDIATTDLTEIRAWVEGASSFTPATGGTPPTVPAPTPVMPEDIPLDNGPTPGLGEQVLRIVTAPAPAPGIRATPGVVEAMHAWMSDAFPTESRQDFATFPSRHRSLGESEARFWGVRMRYEPSAPDLIGVLNFRPVEPPVALEARRRSMWRSDQRMLTSSVFLPRCTEFIVEWSFGLVDDDGRTIWHGLNRIEDADRSGGTAGAEDRFAARPYPFDSEGNARPLLVPFRLRDGSWRFRTDASLPASHPERAYEVPAYLLYGRTPQADFDGVSLTSAFGWVDPLFNRDQPRLTSPTAAPNGSLSDPWDAERPMPWAWPTLVRVTLTLADAADPTVETTFQYVFEAPGSGVSGGGL